MKKALVLCAAMVLATSSAFAVGGIDLSINACPGNPGARGLDGGFIDCAIGDGVVFLGTWAPAEEIPDLVALDGILDLEVQGGLDANGFWDFDAAGCNGAGLTSSVARPSTGVYTCTTPVEYTDAWSAIAISAVRTSPSHIRMAFTCCRPTPLSVVAGQRIFGMQILVDGFAASEAGGSCPGCPTPVCLMWSSGRPVSDGAIQPTELTLFTGNFTGFDNTLVFNGGSCPHPDPCPPVCSGPFPGFDSTVSLNSGTTLCGPVPVKRNTWGQLKSLYR